MRIAAFVSFVAVVHIGSSSLGAQQSTNGLAPRANLFAPSSKPASPPRYLFPTPLSQAHAAAQAAKKPTVVCGMTLIPGDPNVDLGIRRDLPEGGPRNSIRSVDPKVCRQP
jgi:hypothetical protein